ELMELAMSESPAEESGVNAARLRSEGFVRVGAGPGVAAHADRTFAFSCEMLGLVGLDPVVGYVPPARGPQLAGQYPLRLLTLKRHHSINTSYALLPVMIGAESEALVGMQRTAGCLTATWFGYTTSLARLSTRSS
ncbi:MAG: hypothetical protein ACC652_09175, partial [Acidimicrobiales bacterium]